MILLRPENAKPHAGQQFDMWRGLNRIEHIEHIETINKWLSKRIFVLFVLFAVKKAV